MTKVNATGNLLNGRLIEPDGGLGEGVRGKLNIARVHDGQHRDQQTCVDLGEKKDRRQDRRTRRYATARYTINVDALHMN